MHSVSPSASTPSRPPEPQPGTATESPWEPQLTIIFGPVNCNCGQIVATRCQQKVKADRIGRGTTWSHEWSCRGDTVDGCHRPGGAGGQGRGHAERVAGGGDRADRAVEPVAKRSGHRVVRPRPIGGRRSGAARRAVSRRPIFAQGSVRELSPARPYRTATWL